MQRDREIQRQKQRQRKQREGAIGKTDRLRNGRDHTGSNGDRQTYKENRENIERKGDISAEIEIEREGKEIERTSEETSSSIN